MNYGNLTTVTPYQSAENPVVQEKTAVNTRLFNRGAFMIVLASISSVFSIAALVRFINSFEPSEVGKFVSEIFSIAGVESYSGWLYPFICFVGLAVSGLLTAGLWTAFGNGYSKRDILTAPNKTPYALIKAALITKLCGFILKFGSIVVLLIVGLIKGVFLNSAINNRWEYGYTMRILSYDYSWYSFGTDNAIGVYCVCIPIIGFIIFGSICYKKLIAAVDEIAKTDSGVTVKKSLKSTAVISIVLASIVAVGSFVYPAVVLPKNLGFSESFFDDDYSGEKKFIGDVVLPGVISALALSCVDYGEADAFISDRIESAYEYYDYNFYDYYDEVEVQFSLNDYVDIGSFANVIKMFYTGDLDIDEYISGLSGLFSDKKLEAGKLTGSAAFFCLSEAVTAIMCAVYIILFNTKQAQLRAGGAGLPGREALVRRNAYGSAAYGGYPPYPPYQQQYPQQPYPPYQQPYSQQPYQQPYQQQYQQPYQQQAYPQYQQPYQQPYQQYPQSNNQSGYGQQ